MLRLFDLPKRVVSTDCFNLLMVHSQQFRVEQEFLLRRLKCVDTSYNRKLCCMEGTRESLLTNIMSWVATPSGQKDGSNTYWIYGLPGIGKTSLAHSICASLHEEKSTSLGRFSAGEMTQI